MAQGKSDGTVYIDSEINTDGFDKGLKEMESQIKKTTPSIDEISKSMKNVGTTVTKVGAGMSATITAPLVLLGKEMVQSASDMEENLNKVDVAFGNSSESVKKWAEDSTKSFGLSKNQALEATALYGDMATSMGLTQEEASNMATTLAGLSGDLSSFKNIDIEQAMTALNGVFTGETESLKMLGVVMTEVNLEEFANKAGLVYKEMSQAEKVQLRYNYILENTKNAQGDYARTADGTANSIRTMQSSTENLTASLGQHLLPIITPIIQKLTEIIEVFGKLPDGMQKTIIVVGIVVGAIGPLLTALGSLITIAGTLLPLLSTISIAFNPILLAVGAVVLALTLLVSNWDLVIETMTKFDDFLKSVFAIDFTNVFGTVLGGVLNSFFEKVETIWESIKTIFGGIIDFITGVFTLNWEKAWEGIKETFLGIWNLIFSSLKSPINGIIGMINGLINGVVAGINAMINALNSLKINIPNWIPEIGGNSFGFNIPTLSAPQIPFLATGAVIPPNAPFLAMLGDQKSGNNIEAPEELIRKIVREESGNGNNGGNVTFPVYVDGNKLFEIMLSKAKLMQASTGTNVLLEL